MPKQTQRQILQIRMMKIHSKAAVGAVLIAVFLTATPAGAAFPAVRKAGTSTPKTAINACQRIEKITQMLESKLGQRQGKLGEKRTARLGGKEEKRDKRDDTLEGKRSTWDQNREAQYAKLLSRADTDAKKDAVADFKASIESAVAERRASIDKAIGDFRTGIDALATKRKAAIDEAVADFKAEVDGILDEAKSDCEDVDDPKALVESIRLDLTHAREDFAAAMKAIDLRGERDALVSTRKEAIAKAIADFKAKAEEARLKLKSAFGSTS